MGWSPRADILAEGNGYTGTRLWQPSSGKQLKKLETRAGDYPLAFAWSPDGKSVAIRSNNSANVVVWDILSGKLLHTLQHKAAVQSMDFSAVAGTLATATGIGGDFIHTWNAKTGKQLRAFPAKSNQFFVDAVAWSPDGKYLASGHLDNNVRLWNPETGDLLHTLTGHKRWVFTLAWSRDSKTLISGSYDRTQRYWDAAAGRLLRVLNVPRGIASPDDRFQAECVVNAIRFWETESGRPRGTIVTLSEDRYMTINSAGHYYGTRVERDIVYVIQTAKGQETLTPAEFSKRFGWKNDPDQVRLLEK